MGAALRIQTRVGNEQAFNWLVADDVGVDNLVHVGFCDSAIPDCVGIDDDVWPMLALIEAARLVRANRSFDATPSQFNLEYALEVTFARRITTPTRIAGRPLVATNENMFLKFWH